MLTFIRRALTPTSLLAVLFWVSTTQAAGILTPKSSQFKAINIQDHKVNVVIEDGYAITTVDQVFYNPNPQDLEATYSFPVPEQAAVAEFTMWIDGKPVTGEVVEKQKARQIYEEEKQAGRDAGITEKNSYKTFEISVSPVRANQSTRIRLMYYQSVAVDTGIGRYVYPLEEGGVDEQQLAFWSTNDKVQNQFSFDLTVKSGYPVEAVRVPSQPNASVTKTDDSQWQVALHSNNGNAKGNNSTTANEEGQQQNTPAIPAATTGNINLNKDIVVYWRLQDGLPGSVDLATHKPDANGRGTFMLTVTPGDDLAQIKEGRDWIFVLDKSGSMRGKYATLADGVQQALGKLNVNDRFRIVMFNNWPQELTQGFVNATPENINYYSQKVAAVQPDSGTNLFGGLKLGLDSLQADRTTGIILVTDGVANVGETRQKAFLKLVHSKDVRLFTFIMGNSSNRPLLKALTKASGGFALNVSNSDDIVGKILLATSKLTHKAMHHVDIKIKGIKTADIAPQTIGSLYRGQQLIVFGHYWGDGLANVKVNAKVSGKPIQYKTQFAFPGVTDSNPELERLWAYATIEDLSQQMEDFGEKADMKQAATDLGKEYGLVTDYTSMIVVRDEVFIKHGIDRTNKKRLAVEHHAQQQRSSRPAVHHRVDKQQPMFKSHRPSFGSGGGSSDGFFIAALLSLLLLRIFNNRNRSVVREK
ncbi:MAG: VIT and VWA domain-containing protein [Gammaproteobacteria bacterium]|jgi:Ca-activated chloride channel family protein